MAKLKDSRYFDPKLFASVANLRLIARTVVEGMIAGRHQSPFHGFSQEFSEYRAYAPGDDIKKIDWKLAAKLDKVYVKNFEEETNMKAYLLVDISGSMGYGEEKLNKLQYACYCAAALAYLLTRQQDAVGLATFDSAIRQYLAPKASPQHLVDILAVLDKLAPASQTDASHAFHDLAERIRRRGLIVVLSDFLDNLEELMLGMAHFRHKKHEVLAFHILDPREIDCPFDDFMEFEDMETGQRMPVQARLVQREAKRQAEAFIADLRQRCRQHAIEYVPVRTSDPVEWTLMSYLGKRSRMG